MILFTVAIGARYIELQQLTAAHHARIFPRIHQRHFMGRPHGMPVAWHNNWAKVWHLKQLFDEAKDGDLIGYLDNDVLIPEWLDLESLIPEDKDFAAVRNVWGEYNVGVMFWRVNERTRRVIELIVKTGPHPTCPEADQHVINLYINNCRHFQLRAAYNAYPNAVGDKTNPLIMAWHGAGIERAIKEVKQCLAR